MNKELNYQDQIFKHLREKNYYQERMIMWRTGFCILAFVQTAWFLYKLVRG